MSADLTDDELERLTTDELRAKLNELRQSAGGDVSNGDDCSTMQEDALQIARKKEIMELLHDFNDLKDAAQIVLGALANMQGLTIKEVHKAYNLPLKD